MKPYSYGGIAFHPRYEGKCLNYIKENLAHFRSLLNANSLFWIVGSEVMQQPQDKCADANQAYLEELSQYGPEFPRVKRLKAQNKLFYSPTGATHAHPGATANSWGCQRFGLESRDGLPPPGVPP